MATFPMSYPLEVPYGAYIPTLATPFIGNAPGVWEDMRPPNRSCWRLSNDDYTSGAGKLATLFSRVKFLLVHMVKDQNRPREVDSYAKPLNFIEGFQKRGTKGKHLLSEVKTVAKSTFLSAAHFLHFQRVQSLSQAPPRNALS